MSFENTVKELRSLLANVTQDLEKSTLGNKAASQRVRTGTVKLEKIAKQFRKESIIAEKHGSSRGKKAAKPAKKASALRPVKLGNGTMAHKGKAKPVAKPAAKPAKKAAPAPAKAKAAAKPAARPMVGKAQTLNMKKPTAKLPARKPRSW